MGIKKNQLGSAIGSAPIKASSSDLVPADLLPKLSAGSNVSFTLLNPGASEQVQINATGGSAGLVYSSTVIASSGIYNAVTNELVRWDGSASFPSVNLPNSPANNDKVGFVQVSGYAAGGGINIESSGPFIIDGSSTLFTVSSFTRAPLILQFNQPLNCWFPVAYDQLQQLFAGGGYAVLSTTSAGLPTTVAVDNNCLVGRAGSGDISGDISVDSIVAQAIDGLPFIAPALSGATTAVLDVVNVYYQTGTLAFTMPASGAGNDGKRIAFLEGYTSSTNSTPVVATASGSDTFSSSNSLTDSSTITFAKSRGYVEYKYQWLGTIGYGVWVEVTSTMGPSGLSGLLYAGAFTSGANTARIGLVNGYYQDGTLVLSMPTSSAGNDGKRIAFLEGRTNQNPHSTSAPVVVGAAGSDKFVGAGLPGEVSTVTFRKKGGYVEYKYAWQGSNGYGIWVEVASSMTRIFAPDFTGVISGDFPAAVGNVVLYDGADSWVITLPANPAQGDQVITKNSSTNNSGSMSVTSVSEAIDGNAAPFVYVLSGSYLSTTFVFDYAAGSWWVISH